MGLYLPYMADMLIYRCARGCRARERVMLGKSSSLFGPYVQNSVQMGHLRGCDMA